MENVLEQILEDNRKYTNYGHVATYIPELKNARQDDLGICMIDMNNEIHTAGILIKSSQFRVYLNL